MRAESEKRLSFLGNPTRTNKPKASPNLQLFAIAYLPIAGCLGVLPVFFNGVGKTRLTLYLASSVLLLVVAPVLALRLGLGPNGLICALVVANLASLALGLVLAKTSLSASADLRAVAMVLLSFTSMRRQASARQKVRFRLLDSIQL